MKLTSLNRLKPKKLIVFDLDGTIARTKSPMDQEMAELMTKLVSNYKVAVIGGGKIDLFHLQLLDDLKVKKEFLKNLYLFPTTATTFLVYKNGWKKVYSLKLSRSEVKKIKAAFEKVFKEIGYQHPKKTYGEIIEDRGSQVSFSVYGQDLVTALGDKGIRMKEQWKRKYTPVKMKIAQHLSKHLPEFEVRAAGFTTVDVTKKGIDKAYGLKQIEKYLKVKIKDMVFIGDAIFPGGNDYAVTKTPVDYIKVDGPEETKKVIRHLLQK